MKSYRFWYDPHTTVFAVCSYKEISELLFISEKSVQRYIKQYLNTNSVAPTEYQHGPDKLLTDFEQLTVLQSLLVSPSMYRIAGNFREVQIFATHDRNAKINLNRENLKQDR